MNLQDYKEWTPIEELPVEIKHKQVTILVCDATMEAFSDFNFPQVVRWNGLDGWKLTWNFKRFDKQITHFKTIGLVRDLT